MIGLRKIDSGALAEEVRSMGRARPLKEEATKPAVKAGARFGGRRLREGLKIISGFDSYTPWSHADATYARIAAAGKLGELEDWLEEMYPDGIGETELNDLLWFDADEVLRAMGLSGEDDDNGDDDEGEEDEDEDTDDEVLSAMGESAEAASDCAESGKPKRESMVAEAFRGLGEGTVFAVAGNGFEPSSEDDDVGSFAGF